MTEETKTQQEESTLKVGDTAPDGSIYLGRWVPRNLPKKSFDVFAAPEDLRDSNYPKLAEKDIRPLA